MNARLKGWVKGIVGGLIAGMAQAGVELRGHGSVKHTLSHMVIAAVSGALLYLSASPLPPSSSN